MIDKLAEAITDKQPRINDYVSEQLKTYEIPIYSSFDIRNGGYKAATVDPNVFPAGFNNVCQESLRAASTVLEQIIRKRTGETVETIGIYTEDHTKNKYYLQNLHSLLELFENTGFHSLLVTTNDRLDDDPAQLETAMRDTITLHQLKSKNGGLVANDEQLDLVVSNNDFSTEPPDILRSTQTPVTPPVEMGWWNRRKSDHFEHLRQIADELAEILSVDPWLLHPLTQSVDNVDFETRENFDVIAETIDQIIDRNRNHYDQFDIDMTPYAFVKSNHGTYGMGVYKFESGEEFLNINRDTRDSMNKVKGGQKNTSVIVQEGIKTIDRVTGLVAEPVLYCLEHRPVGGFLRTNEEQSDRANLNTRGMNFTSEDLCTLFVDEAEKNEGSNITQDKIEIYRLLATMGTLACGREISDLSSSD